MATGEPTPIAKLTGCSTEEAYLNLELPLVTGLGSRPLLPGLPLLPPPPELLLRDDERLLYRLKNTMDKWKILIWVILIVRHDETE